MTALIALVLLLAFPSKASAHTALRSSTPAAGAELSTAPEGLRLTFSEAVESALARLALTGPDGEVVPLSPIRRGEGPREIVADIRGPLSTGDYTVEWQVVGRDGHPVRDRFRFTVMEGAAGLATAAPAADTARADAPITASAPSASDPGDADSDSTATLMGYAFDAGSPLYAAVRWLDFVATLGLIGTLGFGLAVLPGARRRSRPGAWSLPDVARSLGAVGLLSAITLLAATLLRLVAQSAATNGLAGALDAGTLAAMLGRTLWGTAWIIELAAALVAVSAFLLLPHHRAAGWTMGIVAATAAALASSLSGHAAAVPGLGALAVAVDVLHVLAAGGWLGTLLVLAAVGIPLALHVDSGRRGETAAALVSAFSPLALACAGIVALTGVASAWIHLGGPGALATTGYGRTLLVKLALVALVAAAGAYNWRRVRPSIGDESGVHRLRRSVRMELALGAAVLMATAVLVATPTPLHDSGGVATSTPHPERGHNPESY